MSNMAVQDLLGAGWKLQSEDGKHAVADAPLPGQALQMLHDAGLVEDPLHGCAGSAVCSRQQKPAPLACRLSKVLQDSISVPHLHISAFVFLSQVQRAEIQMGCGDNVGADEAIQYPGIIVEPAVRRVATQWVRAALDAHVMCTA